jgi:DNA-directed RNA polymerase subunit RPC12/RpoP
MEPFDDFTLWAAAAAGLVAVLGAVALWMRGRRASAPPKQAAGALVEHCRVCERDMVFTADQLKPLTGVEAGLMVSARPDLHGKRLAEYICPYCETAHCFVMEGRRPVWADANLFVPEQKRARCMECRKPLKRPPWPEGAYDGRLTEAPDLDPDMGLACPRCKATVCVQCCQSITHGAFTGLYRCPRCNAKAIDRAHHP